MWLAGVRPAAEAHFVRQRVMRVTGMTILRITCLLAASIIPHALAGQVSGRVTDPAGAPVPDALVELWTNGRRVSGGPSDSSGHFAFPSAAGRHVLLVRKIGYDPSRTALEAPADALTVTLTPHATILTPLVVKAAEDSCPPEDPAAQAFYTAVAGRYSIDVTNTGAFGFVGRALRAASFVAAESLGVVDTTQLRPLYIAGTGGIWPPPYRVEYARRLERTGRPTYDESSLPRLESIGAWHFADPRFIALHRFSWTAGEAGLRAVRFCGRTRTEPSLDGIAYAASDSSLARVRFTFVLPGAGRLAGGDVLFAPPPPWDTKPPLLVASGLFWRRAATGFYQEVTEYREWLPPPRPQSDSG